MRNQNVEIQFLQIRELFVNDKVFDIEPIKFKIKFLLCFIYITILSEIIPNFDFKMSRSSRFAS